jgi:hypothetical protein
MRPPPPPRPRLKLQIQPPFDNEDTLEWRPEPPAEPTNAELLHVLNNIHSRVSYVERDMSALKGSVSAAFAAQNEKIAEQARVIASWKTRAAVLGSALAGAAPMIVDWVAKQLK